MISLRLAYADVRGYLPSLAGQPDIKCAGDCGCGANGERFTGLINAIRIVVRQWTLSGRTLHR
jgi:hypothetical protein